MKYFVLSIGTVVCLALAGCGNEYHPEYHPVNVTTVTEQISNPVTVAGAPRPVTVVQQPAQPIVVPAQPALAPCGPACEDWR